MKRLIPLFTFAFHLHLLFALSISSEKIDTFMHLPDWLPTSVDAEHTFGSDEHTNCTHRTTIDTLAAVESVFDAYHERVFYSSDSFPPSWDSSVYGPKPAEGLQTVWFTNALDATSASNSFVYASWTNSWQRAAPDSRRLVEFTNLFSLARQGIHPLFSMRTGTPWLDKGETWGTNRTVMFASSWGPVDKSVPDDVPWTNWRPLEPNEVDFDSMIPLCYCSNDTVFVTRDFAGKEYGLVHKILSSVDRSFNVLGYGVTNETGDVVRRGGILGAWDTVGFSNSVARTTTVPGIITNRFPLAGPEYGMTHLTRRLVPDDYTGSAVSNVYEDIGGGSYDSQIGSILWQVSQFRSPMGSFPEFDIEPKGAPVSFSGRLVNEHYPEYGGYEAWLAVSARWKDPYTSEDREIESEFTTVSWDEKPDRVEIKVSCEIDSVSYSDYVELWPSNYYYRARWIPPETDFRVEVTGYKFVSSTNYTFNASSLLATESRALAMLDRTYELGPFLTTNGPRKAEVTRYRADARNEDEITVTVSSFDNFPFVDIVPITLDDVSLGTPVYQKSNSVEDVSEDAPFTREFARFSGETATGSISFNGQTDPYSRAITASEVLANISESGVRIWSDGFHPLGWDLWLAYGAGNSLIVLPEFWFYDPPSTQTFSFEFDIGEAVKVSRIPVRASVTKTAWYAVSDRLSREFYEHEKNISRVAPGPQAYIGGGRVSKSIVELFSGMLFMRSYVDYDRGPLDSLWFPNMYCASLPYNRPYDDEELDDHPPVPFEFESSFRIRGEEFASYSSVPGKLYAARDDVRTMAILRLSREVVGSSGSMSSAEDVVPIRSAKSVFTDFLADTATVSVEIRSRETGLQVDVLGGDPRIVDADTGETISGATPIAWVLSAVDVMPSLSPHIDRSKLHPAVAVDGRVEPVIVTDWNWKALKSERNNQ